MDSNLNDMIKNKDLNCPQWFLLVIWIPNMPYLARENSKKKAASNHPKVPLVFQRASGTGTNQWRIKLTKFKLEALATKAPPVPWVIRYSLGCPPSQDASGKWRFIGIPYSHESD